MKNIMFVCTANSCRSQMAEGWCRELKSQHFAAFSAGTHPNSVDKRAIAVMAEVGIDISQQKSQHYSEFSSTVLDVVVTLCSSAKASCPVISGALLTIHQGFEDPDCLASQVTTEQQILNIYRRIRDEIRDYIKSLPDCLNIS